MKQTLRLLLLLCAAMVLTQTAKAVTFEVDNITYESTDGETATITACKSHLMPANLIIPATISDGTTTYSVIAIADGANGGGIFGNISKIKSVELPSSLKTIGTGAFVGCTGFTSIDLPEGLETIGDNAFAHCTGLTSATVPENVKALGEYAFAYCSGLKSIDLPEGLETIGANAFNCSGLTSVSIPASVTEIGDGAFNICQVLFEIHFNWTEDVPITPADSPIFTDWLMNEGKMQLYVPAGYEDLYDAWFKAFKKDGLEDLIVYAGEIKDDLANNSKYNSITIQEGGEVVADGKDIVIGSLVIERTFTYTASSNKAQWFNLALPFEGVASGALVQKWDESKQAYAPAECGVDYVTFNYNSERRSIEGATGANWDVLYTEGGGMGELIQFPKTGTHKYRFISPSAAAAQKAIKYGRIGSTYFNGSAGINPEHNGWNIVPAGKTYATANYDLFGIKTIASVQVYNYLTGGFSPQSISSAVKPYEVLSIHLTAPYVAASPKASAMSSDAELESYTLELVNAEGEMLDRIYLFDGSNSAKYRLGKMAALRSGATQMAIRVNGSNYCTYSTLASEVDKSYSIALTNCDDCSLVLKGAGSQTVSVDDATIALDTPVAVENGEIVIKIGSSTSDVENLDGSLIITGENGYIAINGAAVGVQYVIANMGGMTTYGITTDAETQVAVPAGVYAVKVANKVAKVIVK